MAQPDRGKHDNVSMPGLAHTLLWLAVNKLHAGFTSMLQWQAQALETCERKSKLPPPCSMPCTASSDAEPRMTEKLCEAS